MANTSSVAAHLKRTLGADYTPGLAARLLEAGLDVSQPLPRRVPLARIAEWLDVVRETVTPELPRDEGLRALGRRALDGVGHTLTEKAAFGVLRFMGPERALHQAEKALSRSSLGLSVLAVERKAARVSVAQSYEMPEFIEGLLWAFGGKLGLRDTRVESIRDDAGASFHVHWR